MTQTIRGRIAALSFVLFVALVSLVGALVLGGLDRALTRLADRDLREELDDLLAETGDQSLASLMQPEPPGDLDWGDLVFALRDELDARAGRSGERPFLYEILRGDRQLVASSGSLAELEIPRRGRTTQQGGIVFRDEEDPRPAARASLRVAEVGLGPYQLRLGLSLEPFALIRSDVRLRVFTVLALASLLAAAGAFLVAARGLAPVRQLAREAERLRTLSSGTLPRSKRGDEIDELAAVLNHLLDRVRSDVERQRRFTADAAHEIRTPLSAIRGHLELLLSDATEEVQQVLVGVLEEVERLARLVNQLLLLEKLEEHHDQAPRQRLDLAQLAHELVDHLRVVAEDLDISLELRGEAVEVEGDTERLRQVLLNLLDNAFRHTPRGGRVSVEVDVRDGAARMVVRDTGPGVPQEMREAIFERFASDRSRAEAGAGLGLPIARAIARAHGGELRVEESDAGAAFALVLPLAPAR